MSETPATITLPTMVVARMVAGHIHHLWQAWEIGEGCCYICCAPCSALKDLLDAGQLNMLYAAWAEPGPDEEYLWSAREGGVGRDWLNAAWAFPRGCADQHPDEEVEPF